MTVLSTHTLRARRRRLPVLLLLATALAGEACERHAADAPGVAAPLGRVVALEGAPTVARNGGTARPLADGAAVAEGDVVETDEASRVALAIAPKAGAAIEEEDLIVLGPGSRLELVPVGAAGEGEAPSAAPGVAAIVHRGAYYAVARGGPGAALRAVRIGPRSLVTSRAVFAGTWDPQRDAAAQLVRDGAVQLRTGDDTVALHAGMLGRVEEGRVLASTWYLPADWAEILARTQLAALVLEAPAEPPVDNGPGPKPSTLDPRIINWGDRPPQPVPDAPAPPAKPDLVRVRLETSKGEIDLELDRARAPITVANFLKYVDRGFYDGTIFDRVVRNYIVQGGRFTAALEERPADPPIANEWGNGLRNVRGSVGAGRMLGQAESTTSQFYINLSHNVRLDGPQPQDGAGYAVFGRVIRGMDVVDAIGVVPTKSGVPIDPIVIEHARRLEDDGKGTGAGAGEDTHADAATDADADTGAVADPDADTGTGRGRGHVRARPRARGGPAVTGHPTRHRPPSSHPERPPTPDTMPDPPGAVA